MHAFVEQRQVALFVGQLNERDAVVIIGDQPVVPFDFGFERGVALGDRLCGFHVVPKAVHRRLLVQFGRFALRLRKPQRAGKLFNVRPDVFQPEF